MPSPWRQRPDRPQELVDRFGYPALCQGRDPDQVATTIGAGGSAELKRGVTESVNEFLRPIRARRAELAGDTSFLRQVLREGNTRASAVASRTLTEVHAL